jgi:hypothetical protein
MAATLKYAKLSKPEVGGNGLTVQCGSLAYTSAAGTTVNLSTPLRTIIYGNFSPGSGTSSSVPYLTTLTPAAGVVAVGKAAGANRVNWRYLLIGY